MPTSAKHAASLLTLLVPLAVALASLFASCGGDDNTVPTYFLGATDASPPRLGPPADAGTQ
jgi:hypothetical protein